MKSLAETRVDSYGERYEIDDIGNVICPSCKRKFRVDGDGPDGMGPYCPRCSGTSAAKAHKEK